MTYALWQDARRLAIQTLEAEFEFWANKVVYSIESRLNSYVQILRGTVGLFEASDHVRRDEFHRYVEALRLEERYSGIQGIGFAVAFSARQKDQRIAAIRHEGFPNYGIYPDGDRELYTAIIYIEPFTGRNLRAFGYDMFTDPVRQAAMARARDQNQAALSGKVKLLQETETDIQPGFAIYAPVYRHDALQATVEDRRASLVGWAYSPLRMHDVMQGVMGTIEFDGLRSVLNVKIYDGERVSPDALLFDTASESDLPSTSAFNALRSIEFGGHQWLVLLASKPAFDERLHSEKANLIATAGSAGSLLLTLSIGVLTASQARISYALRETAQSNQKLSASEARFRSIYDSSLVGIASWGPDFMFTQANRAFCRLLEYSEQELVGLRQVDQVTHPDDIESCRAVIGKLFRRESESFVVEKRYLTKSGRVFAALTAARASYDEQGGLTGITAAILDITQRKEAEEALRASLEEKTVLLKEVHHRVKNNLQIISSLLNLQIDRTQISEVSIPLRDMQNRVRSMALLHETLYRSNNLAQISLPDYVENLCAQLWRAAGPVTAHIELEYRMDAVLALLDQAVPCGLIVNELVSNALKHAYPDGRRGRIRVIVQVRPDRQILLAVADDGIGLPATLDLHQTATLGLQLVSMLTQQLQGTATILREIGTEFQIVFPIKVV